MKCVVLALSIRQPFAELILRGIKTCEFRSQRTHIIGEQFHIYASLKNASINKTIWSRDLAMPNGLTDWMLEPAEQIGMIDPRMTGATLSVSRK